MPEEIPYFAYKISYANPLSARKARSKVDSIPAREFGL
jgi:hypothetical protein